MVGSKFLHEDGEDDQVVIAEWAISGRLTVSELVQLEMDFLKAIVSNILYVTLSYILHFWSCEISQNHRLHFLEHYLMRL